MSGLLSLLCVALYCLSFQSGGQSHPLEYSLGDYDYFYFHQSLENYNRGDFNRFKGITNRRGSLRLGYYSARQGYGCTLLSEANTGPRLLTFNGEVTVARGFTNDCLYYHFPPFSETFWLGLTHLGLSTSFDSPLFVLGLLIINVLFLITMFLFLCEWLERPLSAAFAMMLVVICKGYFCGLYDVVQRPFENVGLAVVLYLFARNERRRIPNVLFISSIFICTLMSYDYALAIPLLSISFFVRRQPNRPLNALSVGLLPVVLGHCLLILQKIAALGVTVFWRDSQTTLLDRFGQTQNYFLEVWAFLSGYAELLNSQFLSWPLYLFTVALIILARRGKALIVPGFLLFTSLSLGLALPATGADHNFVKFRSAIIWLMPLLALSFAALTDIWRSRRKKLAPAGAVAMCALGQFNGFSLFTNLESLIHYASENRIAAGRTDLHGIGDVTLAIAGRQLGWREHSLRKVLLSSHLPIFNEEKEDSPLWPYPIGDLAFSGELKLQMQFYQSTPLRNLRFLYHDQLPDDCEFKQSSPPDFDDRPFEGKATTVGPWREYAFRDISVNGVLIITCHAHGSHLRRVWLNSEVAL